MKRLIFFMLIFMSFILTSCGGGGGSKSDGYTPQKSGKVSVDLRVKSDVFQQDRGRKIPYNGKFIESVRLKVSALAFTSIEQFITSEVENNSPISLSLDSDKAYTFEIFASDSDNKEMCYGSAIAFVTKDSVTDVNLVCANNSGDPVIVSGVAAAGLPVNGTVYIKDSVGTVRSAVISDTGRFSLDVAGMKPPYILRAEGTVGDKSISLYSAFSGDGAKANVNPYTNLAAAIALGSVSLEAAYNNPSSVSSSLSGDKLDSAVQSVKDMVASVLNAIGISDFDPLSGEYAADGRGIDGVLDNLDIRVSGSKVTVIDMNTGQSLVETSVSGASSASISGDVASNVASLVSSGAQTFEEAQAFLNDLYISKKRGGFSSYLSDSFGIQDGMSRSQFISAGDFTSGVSSLSDYAIIRRKSEDEVLLFFMENLSNGTKKARKLWIKKSAGTWNITGNDRKFKIDVNNFAENASGSNFKTGMFFNFADLGGNGVNSVKITGAGLPSSGVILRKSGNVFKHNGSTDYEISSSDINEANDEFMTFGFIKYEVSGYGSSSASGTPVYSETFMKRSPLYSVDGVSDGSLFIAPSSIQSVFENYPVMLATNAKQLEHFLSGSAEIHCTEVLPEGVQKPQLASLNFYGELNSESGNMSIPADADVAVAVNSCDVNMAYTDSFGRKFLTTGHIEREYNNLDMEKVKAALEKLTFDLIKGDNAFAGAITSGLNLVTDIDGVAVSWISSDPSRLSNSGGVNIEGLTENLSLNLVAILKFGSAQLTKEFNVTLIVQPPAPDSSAFIEMIDNFASSTDFLGNNSSITEVRFNLNFIGEYDGANLTWSSGNTSVIDNDGRIQKFPTASQKFLPVTITLSAEKDGETTQKTFAVTVKPPHVDRLFVAGARAMTIKEIAGDTYGWGRPTSGQLGLGADTTNIRSAPELLAGTKFYALSGVYERGRGIGIDGKLYQWGKKDNSVVTAVDTPETLTASTNWVQVTSAGEASAAINSNGELYTWGKGSQGGSSEYVLIGGGDTVISAVETPVKVDKVFRTKGDLESPINVSTISSDPFLWVQVAAGDTHFLALNTKGEIYSWGKDTDGFGFLGHGTYNSGAPIGELNRPARIGTKSDWVAVFANYTRSYAIDREGSLWLWGESSKALGDGGSVNVAVPANIGKAPGGEKWRKIAIGDSHTLGLSSNMKKVYGWGAASGDYALAGSNSSTPVDILSSNNDEILDIAAGTHTSYMVKSPGGNVWAFGRDSNDVLGNGTGESNASTPVALTLSSTPAPLNLTPTNAFRIAPGAEHYLVSGNSSQAFGFGENSDKRINPHGDASDNYTAPQLIDSLPAKTFYKVQTGTSHSVGITVQGNIYHWGNNLGDPVQFGTDKRWKDVSIGDNHTIMVDSNGTLCTYGDDSSGKLGNGSLSSDALTYGSYATVATSSLWKSISAGVSHSLAVDGDGHIWAWGSNNDGELGFTSVTPQSATLFAAGGNQWVKVSAGKNKSAAIKFESGYNYIYVWGNNPEDSPIVPEPSGPTPAREDKINTPRWINTFMDMEKTDPVSVNDCTDVAMGENHALAVCDGKLFGWGSNADNQLDNGYEAIEDTPRQIGTSSTWSAVFIKGNRSYAVNEDGMFQVWGTSSLGGYGDTLPVDMGAGGNFVGPNPTP